MAAYVEERPQPPLSTWVECAWSIENTTGLQGHRVPPDGCIDIVYDRLNGLRVVGAMTVEQHFDFPPGIHSAGIRFRPGMATPFLRISAAKVTDCSVPLADLRSRAAAELLHQLDDAVSIRDAMRLLLASIPAPANNPNPVQQAITAIAANQGSVDLDAIAWHAGLSSRQFRRRCLEESGLSPKLLSRILRFRHACRLARARPIPNWSAISAEAEYYDQSHFIRDFRAFTGRSPMAVFSNTRCAHVD